MTILRLIRAELRYLAGRRALWVSAALLLAMVVVSGLGDMRGSSDDTASARKEADQRFREARATLQAQVDQCATVGNPDPVTSCDAIRVNLENLEPELFFDDPRFVFVEAAPRRLRDALLAAAVVAALLGAVLAGSDWTSGLLPAQLLVEPRRTRVLKAKLAAFVVCAAVLAIGIGACMLVVDFGVAAVVGTTEGVVAGFVRELGAWVARGAVVAACFGVLGFALASAARTTTAALLGILGYVIVAEIGLRNTMSGSKSWLLVTNAEAFVRGRLLFVDHAGGTDFTYRFLTWRGAGLFLGFVALVAMIGAFLSLLRRDVQPANG